MSFSLISEWGTEIMGGPEYIASKDMSWLFSAPTDTLSHLVGLGRDFEEIDCSPDIVVASQVPAIF